MTRASQTEEELEIFRIFAEVSDYEIDPLTIKSEEPPMPDISAYTKNGERLLFELTRLIDAKLLKLLSLSGNTEKIITKH